MWTFPSARSLAWAGANGVGKSNLFDAIRFLSAMADHTLVDAARLVRGDNGGNGDVRSLFHRVGERSELEMTFIAEMIIPKVGIDEITRTSVRATSNLLRYELTICYDDRANSGNNQPLRIVRENLTPIPLGKTGEIIRFPHSKEWLSSAVGGRRTVPYISTSEVKTNPIIHLHQDMQASKGGGRTFQNSARSLSRTVVSLTNSSETPTALLAKREMQSWRLLQLEPSALRKQDSFLSPTRLGTDGSHLPATLYRLANSNQGGLEANPSVDGHQVYGEVANRLYQLLDEVTRIRVDRDEKWKSLTLEVHDKHNTAFPAKSLSDGTLRFLALSVLKQDSEDVGVICFEEPENGIHPQRIPAILQLLLDIACDAEEPIGNDNPLRQVIVNTHSPGVVGNVNDQDLILARAFDANRDGIRFQKLEFVGLSDTWRGDMPNARKVAKGELLAYLQPIQVVGVWENANGSMPLSQLRHVNALKKTRRKQSTANRPEYRTLFDDLPDNP